MDHRNLSEEEARALWERAASLHAEAAARGLPSGDPDSDSGSAPSGKDGAYSVDVVVRSAVEAGIPAEFVEKALAEMGPEGETPGKVDRWADRYLGQGQRVLRVRRTVDGAIEDVYAAMQRVYPNSPYGLVLAGTDGRAPLDGGALRFEVPYSVGLGTTSNKAITDLRHWADIRELNVRLTPADEGDRRRTTIEMWAHLAHSRRVNFWTGNAIGGALGLAAGIVTTAVVGISILGATAVPEIALAVGAGGATGVGTLFGAGRLWRSVYRVAMRKGEGAMNRLIEALVVDMQTGGAFTARTEPKKVGEGGVKGMLDELGL